MSKLFNGTNETATTLNGAKTLHSTKSACLDFFSLAPSMRGQTPQVLNLFKDAVLEDIYLAQRTILWMRDIRGGAGERDLFGHLLRYLATHNTLAAKSMLKKIPELGRFDDFMYLWNTELEEEATSIWKAHIESGNMLAAKWAPVKDKKGATPLRKAFGFDTERDWRKYIVPKRKTVEQDMCSKAWDNIVYEHVPSLAGARYASAFKRNDNARFLSYLDNVSKGEAKINAGAVYPYDVLKTLFSDNAGFANAQWEALPNFIDPKISFLPVIDVSASMETKVPGTNLSCMDIAVSLGIYMSERNRSAFENEFITFHTEPQMIKLLGSNFAENVNQVMRAEWGGSTDLEKVFDLVLQTALDNNLKQEDLPDNVIIVSDMEFNQAKGDNRFVYNRLTRRTEMQGVTNFNAIDDKYKNAGYKRPNLIFWRVDVKQKQVPVSFSEEGTVLISGFSPAILKSICAGEEFSPYQVFMDTVMNSRYDF